MDTRTAEAQLKGGVFDTKTVARSQPKDSVFDTKATDGADGADGADGTDGADGGQCFGHENNHGAQPMGSSFATNTAGAQPKCNVFDTNTAVQTKGSVLDTKTAAEHEAVHEAFHKNPTEHTKCSVLETKTTARAHPKGSVLDKKQKRLSTTKEQRLCSPGQHRRPGPPAQARVASPWCY